MRVTDRRPVPARAEARFREKYGIDAGKPYAQALHEVVTSVYIVHEFIKDGLKPNRENAKSYYEAKIMKKAAEKAGYSWFKNYEREVVEGGCPPDEFATALLVSLPSVVRRMVG